MVQKFRVLDVMLPDHVDAKPNDFVYRCSGYDYGLASDDTRATGVVHISVTRSRFGAYPSFTMPETALEAVEPETPIYPDDETSKTICRIGQGAETCRYLTMSAQGWSCEKHSLMKSTLNERVRKGEMVAQADNCEGMFSR